MSSTSSYSSSSSSAYSPMAMSPSSISGEMMISPSSSPAPFGDASIDIASPSATTTITLTSITPSSASTATTGTKKRKFLIVNCDDAPKWKGFESTIISLFGDNDTDEWKVIEACSAPKLPSDDELMDYDGVIIPGSRHTTYENDKYPWIQNVHEFVRRIHNLPESSDHRGRMMSGPKVAGICFGAQTIAHALGGRCERNIARHYAIGSEPVQTTAEFDQLLRELGVSSSRPDLFTNRNELRLLEAHFDSVQALPPGGIRLASSPSAPFELFAVRDRSATNCSSTAPSTVSAPVGSCSLESKASTRARFLGVQGHPEFTPKLIEEKILPSALANGSLSGDGVERAKQLMTLPLSSQGIIAVLRAHLRS